MTPPARAPAPLRVHVLTEEDPFYLPVFFREFFARRRPEEVEVTGVDLTPPLNQRSPLALARRVYRLYGPVDFARLSIRYATAKLRDRLTPRGSWDGTVARLAAAHDIPSAIVPDVNDPVYVERLRALAPDILLSVAASQIFREPLLAVPRLDCINIHTGTLPRYRGMLPVFWQMHDGEREIGITIHTMTPRIDLGEILLHRTVPLGDIRSLDAAIREMKRHGARAVLDLLAAYRSGVVERRPMDPAQGRYRSFPGRADARAFRARGLRLL